MTSFLYQIFIQTVVVDSIIFIYYFFFFKIIFNERLHIKTATELHTQSELKMNIILNYFKHFKSKTVYVISDLQSYFDQKEHANSRLQRVNRI